MKLKFDPDALQWMGSHGFGVHEVSEVAELLHGMKRSMAEGQKFIVPAKIDARVSALVSILYSLTDSSGTPTCFRGDMVTISAEAKQKFREALSISREEKETEGAEMDAFAEHLSKAKRRSGIRGK
ncbi:MAG: hypothetical protein NTY83_03380 [Candidatus Micrarchaeota archaeon]|nr:hypothetical protein [Candidatus Micrarchaeota archaeon]